MRPLSPRAIGSKRLSRPDHPAARRQQGQDQAQLLHSRSPRSANLEVEITQAQRANSLPVQADDIAVEHSEHPLHLMKVRVRVRVRVRVKGEGEG